MDGVNVIQAVALDRGRLVERDRRSAVEVDALDWEVVNGGERRRG